MISAVSFRGPFDAALLRCVAIVLITNSHLDALYPAPLMASGGALGNALFFLSSGYGLAESFRSKPMALGAWYLRRLLRLYPATVITVAVFELAARGGWMQWGPLEYFAMFVWPTPAWFISALVTFYAGLYFAMRVGEVALYRAIMGATLLAYAIGYVTHVNLTRFSVEGPSNFKWIFYFLLMVLGAYLSRVGGLSRQPRTADYLIGLTLALAYLGAGYALSQGHLTRYQFAIHAITIPLVLVIAILCRAAWLRSWFERFMPVRYAVLLLAGVTLEIYLLQFYLYSQPFIVSLPFPQNVVIFWLALLCLAALLRAASSWLASALIARRSAHALTPDR